MIPVRTGATDGLMTEIAPLDRPDREPEIQLAEGLRVISGQAAATEKTSAAAGSSRTSQPSQGRPMGPPHLF